MPPHKQGISRSASQRLQDVNILDLKCSCSSGQNVMYYCIDDKCPYNQTQFLYCSLCNEREPPMHNHRSKMIANSCSQQFLQRWTTIWNAIQSTGELAKPWLSHRPLIHLLDSNIKSDSQASDDGPQSPRALKISFYLDDLTSLGADFQTIFRSKVQLYLIKNNVDSLVQLNTTLDNFQARLVAVQQVLESLTPSRFFSNYASIFDGLTNLSQFFELHDTSSIEIFSSMLVQFLLTTLDQSQVARPDLRSDF